jgi:hypothetical protein
MRVIRIAFALGGLLVLVAGCASPSGASGLQDGPGRIGAAADPAATAWDDGMAVVLAYRGRVKRYGTWREAEVKDYLVREFLDPLDLTKRDAPSAGDVRVIKVNRLLEFPTGSYDYRFMSSVFLRRDDGRLVKATGSCQNACGLVFQRWDANSEMLRSDSYWEGEGEAETPLPAERGWRFADEIPYVANRLPVGSEVTVLAPLASPRAIAAPPDDSAPMLSVLGIGDRCAECESPGSLVTPVGVAWEEELVVPSRTLKVVREGRRTLLVAPDGTREAEFVYDEDGFLLRWTLRGEQEFRRVAAWRGAYWARTAPEDRSLMGGR